jgi:hypothetical protein
VPPRRPSPTSCPGSARRTIWSGPSRRIRCSCAVWRGESRGAVIERWGETGERRSELRFLALVHDALKFQVSNWRPKTGENHHATRARRFAERYTGDERLLAVIEQHDRPYNLWRRRPRRRTLDEREIERIIERVPDLDLFTRFLELDCSTEGKNPEPVRWFEEELESRGLRPA